MASGHQRQLRRRTRWARWSSNLFDTNTKKLIWRGSASDTLSDKSTRTSKTQLGRREMFDHFSGSEEVTKQTSLTVCEGGSI
jgi:hypothetical protein